MTAEKHNLYDCPTCGAPVRYTPAGSNHVVGDWNEEWEYEAPDLDALAARVRELEAERDGYNELQGTWRNRAEDAEARVRELEQERQGLIERFHAECCETECKCHCDELRAALASPQRSA